MAATHTNLPSRTTGSSLTDDEAVPDIDPTNTSGLLQERLQAYKHACGYLENYITATEKVQKAHAKEYEKILKVRITLTHQDETDKLSRPYLILSKRVTISTKTWVA